MIMNVYVYRKNNEPLELFKEALDSILKRPEDTFQVYTEAERGYMALRRLEEESDERSIWIVNSIKNLGNTIGEIRLELIHILEAKISLLVVDYPSMNAFESVEKSDVAIRLLCDVYNNLPGINVENISAHPLRAGRKKASYPEGWATLYQEWEEKKNLVY